MKAVEVTGEIDAPGNLTLDEQVLDITNQRVRVLILASEAEDEFDPDDHPLMLLKAIYRKRYIK